MKPTRFDGLHAQRGAVLIVALVLLLVLTVLGTAGIQDTTMEERMAGNYRDYSVALEAAEAALRTGEAGIANPTIHAGMAFNGSDGTYAVTPSTVSVNPRDATNYALSVDAAELTSNGKQLVNAVPQYFIERLPRIIMPGSDLSIGTQNQPPRIHYYRISAMGNGVSPNSEVVLQSTYFDWNGN